MKKENGFIYKLEGVDPFTWEVSSYIWSTNNIARRMQEHAKSGLLDNLCQTQGTEYEWSGYFHKKIIGILSTEITASNDIRNEESKMIKEEKQKPYRNINKRI